MTLPTSAIRWLGGTTPALLVRAAHPRQALLTTIALTAAASLSGRAGREVALVAATVLVGQLVLGWNNDLVDASADHDHQRIKPIVDGLPASTLSFALTCAVLLLIPLSVNNGLMAGACYLVSVAVGALGTLRNRLVRQGPLSWLPWAISFGLYPAFLSYGGWGGRATGDAPSITLTVLCALLGVGVHVFTALWGLVADDADGWHYLPLWLARRTGATPLLLGSIVYLGVVGAAIAVVAEQSGLAA
ncbi:hypothetical protein [Nocardioides sp. Kera G14]|uniref:hypothetical protein n=1 Tax=Nocardioides sp. Kera G14 TaxID=2884264 RepID=UPI001D0F68DC|nr:hypothetical protein [Nocardioides sp. Kera G14]UDY24182.1 hypothetical protein LH076_02475 [Nocardioides sp. Kera G14]